MTLARRASGLLLLVLLAPSGAGAEPAREPVPTGGAPVGLELEAERLEVDLVTGRASADSARLSACAGCESPYSVSARRAVLHPDGDLDLLLPVLRLGPVPVLALPWLRIRTGRRPGLLLPRVGYRSGGGVELGQGLFAPLGRSAEATVRASWLSEIGGAELRAALRADRGSFEARLQVGRELLAARLSGEGFARSGRLTAAARLAWTAEPEASAELAPEVAEQALADQTSRATVVRTGEALQASLEAGLAQTLGGLEAGQTLPWTGLGLALHPVGAGPVRASGLVALERRLTPGGPWPAARVVAEPRVALALRAGPVLTRLALSSRHVSWPVGAGDLSGGSSRQVVGSGLDLAAPLRRAFAGGLVHLVEPRLAYRLVLLDLAQGPLGPRGADRAAWPLSGHLLGLSVRSSLVAPRRDYRLQARATQVIGLPVLAGLESRPRLDLELGLEATAASVRLEATLAERPTPALSEAAVTVDLEPAPYLSLALGYRWLSAGAGPTTGPDPFSTLAEVVPFALARGETLAGRLAIRPVAELELVGAARVDLGGRAAVLAGGGLSYRDRCGCLAASLQLWQRHGRPWPDVLLTAELGGLVGGR